MTASRAPFRDGWLCGLIALIGYHLLAQTTLYGDGAQFAVWATSGYQHHPVHHLYLPMLNGISALLAPIGVSFYTSACLLSALGTAIGVTATHFGCRCMNLSRANCVIVAALVGTCPGIVFFATVLEVHGAFFGFVGLVFWCFARLLRRPSVWSALVAGLASGLAFCAHGSALVLPGAFGLWVLAEARVERAPWRPLLGLLALVAVVHAASIAGARWLFTALGAPGEAGVQGYFETMGSGASLWPELGPTVFYEWVWAYYPLSILCLVALRSVAGRVRLLALAVAMLPYLAVSLVIVHGMNERGAYLMPFAILGAWLVVHSVSRTVALIAAGVALAVALAAVWEHDEPRVSRELAAGIEACADGKPVLLFVSDQQHLQASLAFLPGSKFIWLGTLLSVPTGLEQALFDRLLGGVREHRAAGGVAVLPAQTLRLLTQLSEGGNRTAAALLHHFRADYRGTLIESGSFHGRQLELP